MKKNKNNKAVVLVKDMTLEQRIQRAVKKGQLDEYTWTRIVHMAMWGMANKAIQTELGVTMNQIYSAQKWANVRKADYRNATSPLGKEVVRRINRVTEQRVLAHLERLMLK